MWSVSACVLVFAVSVVWGYDTSTTVDDFLSLSNGEWDNLKEIERGDTDHKRTRYTIIPFYSPAIRPAKGFYHKWTDGNKTITEELVFLTETSGNLLDLSVYNVKELRRLPYGAFNVKNLSKLRPENLPKQNCTGVYKKTNRNAYSGVWYDCEERINGNFAFYADIYTCNDISTFNPPTKPDVYSQSPYIYQKIGSRYPMPGLTDTFDQICGGTY